MNYRGFSSLMRLFVNVSASFSFLEDNHLTSRVELFRQFSTQKLILSDNLKFKKTKRLQI